MGTALLEVTAPRTPCAKFQAYWGVPQLIKRFTARGASGAYLRVVEPGEIGAGDAIEVVHRPEHGVTTGLAFRAFTTEQAPAVRTRAGARRAARPGQAQGHGRAVGPVRRLGLSCPARYCPPR